MSDEFLRSVQNTLDEVRSALESLNDRPNVAPVGIDDASNQINPSKVLSRADMLELRGKFRTKSYAELNAILSDQAGRFDTGIPLGQWMAAGGSPLQAAIAGSPVLTRALDSSSGSALIRQDLEPVLYELFVREFPYWDRIPKEPANGLVHRYQQLTSFGDAQFMPELGTVTDDNSTYVPQTTNVAVLATRRGVSFKGQFATIQGGAGFNPEQLEITGGLRAVAHRMQKTIFEGNASDSGGTSADEAGAYDANSFDGLRKLLNTARAEDVDPFAGTPEQIRAAINAALIDPLNNGGRVDSIYLNGSNKILYDNQLDPNVRHMGDLANSQSGANVTSVNTVFGSLGLNVIAGDSIGEYERSAQTVSDIYLLDGSSISVPYLGSEGPTVLDIPVGVSGQLVRLFIIFGMWGFAVKAPIWSNKVRVSVD